MSTINPSSLSDSLAQLQQLFGKADKNKSGGLSQSEFAQAAQGIQGLSSQSGTSANMLFKQMDTDGNGELTSTELAAGIKLAEKVHDAILKAQELTSGSTLMNLIGGKSDMAQAKAAESGSSDIADLFTSDSSDKGDNQINQLIQQVMEKYKKTEAAATATQPAAVSQSV